MANNNGCEGQYDPSTDYGGLLVSLRADRNEGSHRVPTPAADKSSEISKDYGIAQMRNRWDAVLPVRARGPLQQID